MVYRLPLVIALQIYIIDGPKIWKNIVWYNTNNVYFFIQWSKFKSRFRSPRISRWVPVHLPMTLTWTLTKGVPDSSENVLQPNKNIYGNGNINKKAYPIVCSRCQPLKHTMPLISNKFNKPYIGLVIRTLVFIGPAWSQSFGLSRNITISLRRQSFNICICSETEMFGTSWNFEIIYWHC